MCTAWFKNLFHKPEMPVYPYGNKILLDFVIGNYPGSENDLYGPPHDQDLARLKLTPHMQIRAFRDSEVTRAMFRGACELAFSEAKAGDVIFIHYSGHGTYVPDIHGDEIDGYDEALYLFDGPLLDDDTCALCKKIPVGVTVLWLLDCCFSGGGLRDLNDGIISRFVPPKNVELIPHLRIKQVVKSAMNCIVFSACLENETAADAEINGEFYGAFSFYAFNTFRIDYTYRKWFDQIRSYLPNKNFEQTPTVEGPDELLDKLVLT